MVRTLPRWVHPSLEGPRQSNAAATPNPAPRLRHRVQLAQLVRASDARARPDSRGAGRPMGSPWPVGKAARARPGAVAAQPAADCALPLVPGCVALCGRSLHGAVVSVCCWPPCKFRLLLGNWQVCCAAVDLRMLRRAHGPFALPPASSPSERAPVSVPENGQAQLRAQLWAALAGGPASWA